MHAALPLGNINILDKNKKLSSAKHDKNTKIPPFRDGQKISGNVFLIYCSSTRPEERVQLNTSLTLYSMQSGQIENQKL